MGDPFDMSSYDSSGGDYSYGNFPPLSFGEGDDLPLLPDQLDFFGEGLTEQTQLPASQGAPLEFIAQKAVSVEPIFVDSASDFVVISDEEVVPQEAPKVFTILTPPPPQVPNPQLTAHIHSVNLALEKLSTVKNLMTDFLHRVQGAPLVHYRYDEAQVEVLKVLQALDDFRRHSGVASLTPIQPATSDAMTGPSLASAVETLRATESLLTTAIQQQIEVAEAAVSAAKTDD
ncbi:hypothetical protein DFS34DRAFT_654912 [Phlyctochytrium arcticum]|nr:hypothetical protein DFS34DRAFT_654912 [Phlyctochytrium arcticum]